MAIRIFNTRKWEDKSLKKKLRAHLFRTAQVASLLTLKTKQKCDTFHSAMRHVVRFNRAVSMVIWRGRLDIGLTCLPVKCFIRFMLSHAKRSFALLLWRKFIANCS